jgi:hypothetical protein
MKFPLPLLKSSQVDQCVHLLFFDITFGVGVGERDRPWSPRPAAHACVPPDASLAFRLAIRQTGQIRVHSCNGTRPFASDIPKSANLCKPVQGTRGGGACGIKHLCFICVHLWLKFSPVWPVKLSPVRSRLVQPSPAVFIKKFIFWKT